MNFTHAVVVAGKSEIHKAGQQPENSGKSRRCSLEENFFFFRHPQSLLLGPSTDWLRPTHITEGHVLYPESTDFNDNHV